MHDEHAIGSGREPEPASPDRGAVGHDDAIDPWARGGTMSTAWVTPAPARPPTPDERETLDDAPAAGHPSTTVGRRAVLAGAVVAIGTAAIAWGTVAVDPPAAVDPPVQPAMSAGSGSDPTPILLSNTLVGPISWMRVDGDDASLPARLTGRHAAGLFGSDETEQRWRSVDGRTWTRTADPVSHTVGGLVWSVVETQRGDAVSVRSAGADLPATIDIADEPDRTGFDIVVDVGTGPAAAAPIELDGGVFLFATVSARLPWVEITGGRVADAHRVEVTTEDGEVRSTAGVFHEMEVSRFDLSVEPGGRHLITDESGEIAWSFDPTNAPPWSPIDIVSGAERATWARWNGERFVAQPVPWAATDRVQIATTPEGVIARSNSPTERTPSFWRSADGLAWQPVELPDAPRPNLPVTLYAGDGEAIVTATTELGRTSWTTADGATWEALVPARGVDRRIRTSFGWIAADPRSAPQIHVSPDGSTWDLVALGDALDMPGADWDVTITVDALGSDIVVLADGPDQRTVLIGSVGSSP